MSLKSKFNVGVSGISIEVQGVSVPLRKDIADQVERLYEENYDSVYRYLVLTDSTPADADEFVQEAFLRLFRYVSAGNHIEKPRHWLLRVVQNLRVDEGRKKAHRLQMTESESVSYLATQADLGLNPEALTLQRERVERVRAALAGLTQRQFEYLLLRAEGLKLGEIAQMFEVTVQTVAESCARAIERLGRVTHE
jgi:RNA polymerase sigma-70 factor (ECF subfamily)